MKNFTFLCNSALLTFLLLCHPLQAQEYPNPFNDNRNTFNQEDIVILYNEAGTSKIVQRVYGYDWISQIAGQPDNLILPLTPEVNLDSADLGNGKFLSVSSGRFNDDNRDDMVYIIDRGDSIKVGLNTMDTEFDPSDSSYTYNLGEPRINISIPGTALSGSPRNSVGDFDGDGTDELAMAYWLPQDSIVHIQILDADNSGELKMRAQIGDQQSLRINGWNAFDLSSGDLNGDGADEIILTGLEKSKTGNAEFQVFVKVYEVNSVGSAMISSKAYLVIDDKHLVDFDPNDYQLGYAQTAVTGMRTHPDTLSDKSEDIFAAFAYLYYGDPQFDYDNFFQFLIRSDHNLTTLNIVDTLRSFASTGVFQQEYPLELKTGDLNGDFIEDAVLFTNGGRIFTVINDSIMYKGNSGGVVLQENNSGISESIDRVELGDVDQDGRDEIITFSKGTGDNGINNFFISISGVLEDFKTDTLPGGSYTFTDESKSNRRSYAIATGNLDGQDLHFGEPRVLECEYLQPVFIIGAIPSHFDIINGTPYDVNNCFPEQDCDMEVKITQSQSTSTSAQVEISSDWAVSSNASLSAQASGIQMGTSLEAKYGVKFNKVNKETHTQTLTIAITASSDDVVQYIKIPVTIYQYPVLDAAEDTARYVIAAFPANNYAPQTIVANGKSIFNYTPDHEVGNILSYPTIGSGYEGINDVPKTAGNWIILNEKNVPNYTMSPSGGINYTLNSGSELKWTESTESYAAINTGISPLGFGLGLPEDMNGTDFLDAQGLPTQYPPNDIKLNFLNLYTNTISTETEFSITPTNIIGSSNEFNYVISPRIYWNTDGSGVVYFEVDVDNSTGSGSFWSTAYNDKPDPALNLPYRYDLIHNPNLTNKENLDRTKSIRFSSSLPQENDTVSLYLKVFNYSFVNTNGPVEFELFHEDPDKGGTIIEDVNGNTLFETKTGLKDRGRVETEVKFIATADIILDDFTKIYVLLDPNNKIDEIHEENNKGWTQLGYRCNQPGTISNPTNIYDTGSKPSDYLNIYPIPAGDQVVIEYYIHSVNPGNTILSIHNLTGMSVAQFDINPNNDSNLFWDTRNIAPGVYIANIISEDGLIESKKIIIAK